MILKDKLFQAKLIENLSGEAYHSNKKIIGSSALKTILKSPQSFLSYMSEPKIETEAMRFGTLFHTALLEPDKFKLKYVVQPDFGDLRTKIGKEAKAEWVSNLSPDAEPISKDDDIKIQAMIQSVMNHNDSYILEGIREATAMYADPLTGILCKVRPDCYNVNQNVLIDVKTVQDCSIEEFSKDIANRLYHFQMAMYMEGLEVTLGKKVDYPIWIAVEKTAPYECAFYEADQNSIDIGRELYRRALDTLSNCIDSDTWAHYQSNYQTISLPAWAIKQGV